MNNEYSKQYQWAIVGGGIHGCCVAHHLVRKKNISKENIIMIDPHQTPLQQWTTLTGKIGMKYLRSPMVHQIDTEPFSLRHYARQEDYASPFKGRFKRPRLDMFNAHSKQLIEEAGINSQFQTGTVNGLNKVKEAWEINLTDGQTLYSDNVVVAIGVNHSPYYPDCFRAYQSHPSVKHVFNLEEQMPKEGRHVVIVGGGMTAAHLACKLSKNKAIEKVTLVKRHSFRVHSFDSDPGWLGPKFLNKFKQIKSYVDRRSVIQDARHKGSITKDLHHKLRKAEEKGTLNLVTGEIEKIEEQQEQLIMQVEGYGSIRPSSIVLATGASTALPGSSWLQPLIKEMDLACAPCGFPIVSKSLEWSPHLYVTGPLAELEIGPSSRNIAGAKKAADRIVEFA